MTSLPLTKKPKFFADNINFYDINYKIFSFDIGQMK